MIENLSISKQVALFAVSMSMMTTLVMGIVVTGKTVDLPFGVVDPDHTLIRRTDGSSFTVNDLTFFSTVAGVSFGIYAVIGKAVAKRYRSMSAT